jgi:hypothetical protein
MAGSNSNGAIIVHTNDAYNYSAGTVCTTTLGAPATCEEAITRSDKNFVTLGQRSTVWFLAAFLPTASPRVASVYFGTDVDDANFDAGSNYGPCGPAGTQQVPDAGWPYDVGNSVGFGTPILGNTLFRFYALGSAVLVPVLAQGTVSLMSRGRLWPRVQILSLPICSFAMPCTQPGGLTTGFRISRHSRVTVPNRHASRSMRST